MSIYRRKGASSASGGGATAAVQSRLDRVRDATSFTSIGERWNRALRKIGLTPTGRVALIGVIFTYIFGRIIGGLPILLLAYGQLLLLISGYALARRRLRMEGERSGLYPRAQQGDRLNVEVVLRAQRSVSTFILEERIPTKLGRPVRVPIARLPAG